LTQWIYGWPPYFSVLIPNPHWTRQTHESSKSTNAPEKRGKSGRALFNLSLQSIYLFLICLCLSIQFENGVTVSALEYTE
jgi:hypothetical protein